jgi:TrmH family RNA methyltransferase
MITSRKNPKIQQIRALLTKKSLRQESGQCVLEGTRLLEEALQAQWQPSFGFFCAPNHPRAVEIINQCAQLGASIEEVPPDLLQYMADTSNPQGIIAVFNQQVLPVPHKVDFVLVLDAIRDPGNLGTILRTAAAADVNLVLLSDDCVDPFSPKVLRSGMGAQFRLPLLTKSLPDIQAYCLEQKLTTFIADSNANNSYWNQDYHTPLALVIGNEANGPSPVPHHTHSETIKIPMPGGFESLNAAVAAGILLFEIVHQRKQ